MSTDRITLRPATPADYQAVAALLIANDLPVAGLDRSLDGFHVAESDNVIVGVCGVERAEGFGLLRSAVVEESWRGSGVGRRLVEATIADARRRGIEALYLLTTTATTWFPVFGFTESPRETAPAPIRATAEFSSACPASAAFMELSLS